MQPYWLRVVYSKFRENQRGIKIAMTTLRLKGQWIWGWIPLRCHSTLINHWEQWYAVRKEVRQRGRKNNKGQFKVVCIQVSHRNYDNPIRLKCGKSNSHPERGFKGHHPWEMSHCINICHCNGKKQTWAIPLFLPQYQYPIYSKRP